MGGGGGIYHATKIYDDDASRVKIVEGWGWGN